MELICTKCKSRLTQQGHSLKCDGCGEVYAIINGVPVFFNAAENKYLKDEIEWHKSTKGVDTIHEYAHRAARDKIEVKLKELNADGNTKILSVGVGEGLDVEFIEKITNKIVGLDISRDALTYFKDKYGYEAVVAEAREIPFPDNSFDFVIISGLLHHIVGYGEIEGYLKEFRRVLRRSGYLIVVEPNILYPIALLMFPINSIMQKVRPMWGGKVPHERSLSAFYIANKLKKVGFIDIKFEATTYCHNKYPLFINIFLEKIGKYVRKTILKYFGWWFIFQAKKAD